MKRKNPFETLADIDDQIEQLMRKRQRILDYIEKDYLPKWEDADTYYSEDTPNFPNHRTQKKFTYKLPLHAAFLLILSKVLTCCRKFSCLFDVVAQKSCRS